jgi:hypothetical protein
VRPNIILVAGLLGLGVAFGLALPEWRTERIEVYPGGRAYRLNGGPTKRMPAMLTFPRNGRTTLHIVNRDSSFRALGAIAVPPRRQLRTPPEACVAHDSSDRIVSLLLW